MSIHIDICHFLKSIKAAPETKLAPVPNSDTVIRSAVSDGAYYVWNKVMKPVQRERVVQTDQLNFDSFSLEDIYEIMEYFSDITSEHRKKLRQFQNVYRSFDAASPQKSYVAFL